MATGSFSALTELFADWYWELDEQLRLTYRSSGFAEKTGLDPADDYWDRHRTQLERRTRFRDFEIQRMTREGSRWLSLSGEPVFDDAGAFKGYRGVGRDITAQKRGEQLLRLEHAVARGLAQATSVSEGLRAALRAICEIEGWDYGRCFRVDPDGATRFEDGWFAREPATEQFLQRSRIVWQGGKSVWSKSPDEASGAFATFAFPAVSQGRTIGVLAFSGHRAGEPDARLLEAAQDLYASRVKAFLRVTLPLSLPGVFAGTLLTFIPAAGDFINAQLLGTPREHMIGNVIQSKFLELIDYPAAAALSFVLMAAIVALVAVYARSLGTERLTG